MAYRNLSGNSSIVAYEINEDSIHVLFTSGVYRNYLYNPVRPGNAVVERMKRLAAEGRGPGSFISSVVKKNHAKKW